MSYIQKWLMPRAIGENLKKSDLQFFQNRPYKEFLNPVLPIS